MMIEELLNKYHEDDFDDLLIEIIKQMKDVKERREIDREDDEEWDMLEEVNDEV